MKAPRFRNRRERFPRAPVETASPIILDALEQVGLGVSWIVAATSPAPTIAGIARLRPLAANGGTAHLILSAAVPGDCRLRRQDDAIELRMVLGGQAVLRTRGDTAMLLVAAFMPASVAIAARGLPLHVLVTHPLLTRSRYRVRSVDAVGRTRMTAITFDAPRVPL